ncbi:DNA-directed RNA polymerase N/8 kDa subunit superfamily [Histoplasma ohiense]|nr:DNA-directed RNA polymerase N/8 kDa subunit superfamily [Histoplasma ohiense (nom. inval.)]
MSCCFFAAEMSNYYSFPLSSLMIISSYPTNGGELCNIGFSSSQVLGAKYQATMLHVAMEHGCLLCSNCRTRGPLWLDQI